MSPYGPAELGIQQAESRPFGETAQEIADAQKRREAAQQGAPARPTNRSAAPPTAEPTPGPPLEPPRDTPPGGQELLGHPGGPSAMDYVRFAPPIPLDPAPEGSMVPKEVFGFPVAGGALRYVADYIREGNIFSRYDRYRQAQLRGDDEAAVGEIVMLAMGSIGGAPKGPRGVPVRPVVQAAAAADRLEAMTLRLRAIGAHADANAAEAAAGAAAREAEISFGAESPPPTAASQTAAVQRAAGRSQGIRIGNFRVRANPDGTYVVSDAKTGKPVATGADPTDAMNQARKGQTPGDEAPPSEPKAPPPGAQGPPKPPAPPARGADAEPPVPIAGEPNLGINLDKVDAPDHLKDLIRQSAMENLDAITAQRRGVQSIEDIFARARNLGIDVPALAKIRAGTAFNAEGAVSLFNAVVKVAARRSALEEQMRTAGSLVSPELEARWLAAVYDQNTLQRVFAGGRAEAGRSLRALRELSSGAQSGRIQDTFSRALDAIGGRANLDKLIQRFRDIQTNPNLSPLQREIAAYKLVGSLDRPRFWDKINELFINSILSNPLTHQANVFGQAVLFEADTLSQLPAAAFDAVVSGGGRLRPRTRTMQGALVQAAAGHMALRRALSEGLLYMRHGVAAEEIEKFRESGVLARGPALQDVRIGRRNVAPIGTVINLPTRALGAEDVFFNRLGYQRQLWQDAANYVAREGRDELFQRSFWTRVADIADHPDDFLMDGRSLTSRAEEAGRRAGLRQDAGEVSRLLTRVRDVEIPRTGGLAPGRFITPFVRIGFNLARVGAEYSPLGFVRVATETGGTRADAFGRALIGSSLWWFFWSRADSGDLTGAAPSDARERAEFQDAGKRPYAIRVGDRWVEYSRYEPIASTLKWIHGLHEAAKDVESGIHDPSLFGSALAKATGTVARSLTDASYFSGFQEFYSIATSSEAGLGAKIERFAGNLVNSIVPYSGARRFVAQQEDPVLRHPTTFLEQVEAATPGLSEQVRPYLTRWGEPVGRPDRPAGVVTSAEKQNPVDIELQAQHGRQKITVDGAEIDPARIFVTLPQQDIAGFKLSADEGFLLQQTAGRATRTALAEFFSDHREGIGEDGRIKRYSQMTDREKSQAIATAIGDARRTARATVADAILESATTDGQVERGASMRLATLSKVTERADFLAGLQARGKLTSTVRDFLNRNRRRGERTVEEYLRLARGR